VAALSVLVLEPEHKGRCTVVVAGERASVKNPMARARKAAQVGSFSSVKISE
jgi:microcompartment protein CcmL/EutN